MNTGGRGPRVTANRALGITPTGGGDHPMEDHASPQPSTSADDERSLAVILAAYHDALTVKIALLETEQAAGQLTPAQVREQAAAAHAAYDRDCALARVAAQPGRETCV